MLNTRLYIYFYALLIQLFVLGYILWGSPKRTTTVMLFINSMCWNIAVLVLEGSTWLIMIYEGARAVRINFIINTILYSINLLPMVSMFIYFDYRVLKEGRIRRRRILIYSCLVVAMWTMNISNYWTGILFRISPDNVYSRGPGMYYTVGVALTFLLLYGFSMIRHMRSIEGRLLGVMLSFTIMPISGAILQAFIYGIPAMWTMFTLLSLFIFIFVEREDMMRDTLTNLVTRGQFEQRLKKKLKKDRPFTLIMVDMDKFKRINDTYGHEEGDKFLIVLARILEHCIKHIDMASRYGGDEFMLLLESSNPSADMHVMDRIYRSLEAYNGKGIKPYKIQLSMGSFFIEVPKKSHYLDVLARVDDNMYKTKRAK